MITERLMLPGSWQLRLIKTTPPSITDALELSSAAFGHIIITPTRVPAESVTAATLLSLSIYTGILRERQSQFELGGPGLAAWLGDEDGKGDVLETAITKTAGTFVQWVTDLCPSSLTAGTYTAIAGTLAYTAQWMSRRAALDYVCDYFGGEWRVTPAGVLDAGTAADLFVSSPTAVVQRRSGGRDLNVTGIRADLDAARDYDDYTTRVVLLGSVATGSADISPATSFKDLNGNAVEWTRIIESNDTQSGNENTVAQAQLNRFTGQRSAVTLRADAYDLPDDVAVGDTIYVWDPDLGFMDTTNQVTYRGQVLFPQEMRVRGMSWPVQRGMGVYFRAPDAGGTITDLSDWVEFETGSTQVEVGANPRSVTDSVASAERAATFGPWQSYTPAWSSTGTQPAVGDGSIVGRWSRSRDNTIRGSIRLTVGTTTSAGTGNYGFSLPVTPASFSTGGWAVSGFIAAASNHSLTGVIESATASVFPMAYGNSLTFGAGAPALANGYTITVSFQYEAA